MKHLLFLTFIIVFFTGCFGTKTYQYSPETEKLSFKVQKDRFLHFDLINPKYTYTFDSCTDESYKIEDARLFVEYISLKSNCKWEGASNCFFEYQIKEKLKLKSLTSIERFDVGNYTFSTLKVNDSYKLQTIHYWAVSSDLFIIDYDGTLTFSLLKELNVYEKFQSTVLPRYTKRYNKSLVRMNFINRYFKREDERIIIIK